LRDLFDLIHRGNKVFISQVEGPALAGGCGLATLCDFCYASPEATFGYTESKIGFVPALVAVYLQYRIAGHHMRELLLTGKIMAAEEAHSMGLVNRVVSDDRIGQEVTALAEQLCETVSSGSVAYIKQLLRKVPGMDMDEALEYAASLNAEARSSADCIKGIDAFLNKEKIKW
jgi:methylglutaconyl-CoA hydratase